MVLKGFDGPFCCVDMVIGRFHELPIAVFCFEECFNRFGCLVVVYIKGWLMEFVFEFLKDFLEGLHDGVNSDIFDWNCKKLAPAQNRHFFYTRSHLSALQNCALLYSTNFSLFS